MMTEDSSLPNSKYAIISTLEIVEINFLMSLKGLKPELVPKQVHEEINHIAWIVGHCVSHMDWYLSIFFDERKLTDEHRNYHAFGASKNEIKDYPFSFKELIDNYLKISKKFFKKLNELSEEKYYQKPSSDAREIFLKMIQRISLHIMGHVGQIVILRRMLGDPYWSFIGGVGEEERKKLKAEWIKWWETNRINFD
ncbi:MAG: DUF1572 family protein [Candidatus Heimdallarchaeota archaeon]|nr:DUF1572 family protein [Candidatus Heimdallarchaeota archaeon]MCK4955756.1 DUF1572 family protein [Candidatus Heimdallarchaeota archaeon]